MPTVADTVASVGDARPLSVWLDRPTQPVPGVAPDLSALEGSPDTDLLVIGGGFTGLWAAAEAAAAGRAVTLVDAGPLGAGASGKCGGFVNASITHGIAHGHARWPAEMPTIVELQQRLWDDTLELLAARGAGDAIVPCGKLTVATRPHHVEELAAATDVLHAYGQDATLLDRAAVRSRIDSPTYLGGLELRTANGLCDPVALTTAIASLAVERGARLVERTPVHSVRADGAGLVAALGPDGATITARQVLLATNAFPPLRRRLRWWVIPVYDHVIATAPLSATQWADLGWTDRIGVTDAGNQFHYYRPTPDGRILFGGWDATYHRGGRVDERLEHRPATHRLLAHHLLETFPQLAGVEITHAWGGPIDSTSRFTPTFGTAHGGRLGWAVGFTGLGVGASRFGALAALDLLGGHETERTRLRMVRRAPIPFPPEPLRWPIVAATKRALATEDHTGRRGIWLRVLDRFGVGFDT